MRLMRRDDAPKERASAATEHQHWTADAFNIEARRFLHEEAVRAVAAQMSRIDSTDRKTVALIQAASILTGIGPLIGDFHASTDLAGILSILALVMFFASSGVAASALLPRKLSIGANPAEIALSYKNNDEGQLLELFLERELKAYELNTEVANLRGSLVRVLLILLIAQAALLFLAAMVRAPTQP